MKTRVLLLTLLALLALTVVACGGGQADAVSEPVDVTALADNIDVDTAAAVKDDPGVFMLDVREPDEYAAGHIPGVTLIPMGEIPGRMSELPKDKEIIVTCRSGNRSGQVADYLRQQGFTNVHNMTGGILDWEAAGHPVER